MAITLDGVYRALKRELSPVYYLTGDQDILKQELAEAIIDRAVDPSARDFNLDSRSAADLDGESLHALVETPPMMADRRAVLIRNLEQWRANASVWKVLLRYVARPANTTVLILTHGAGEEPNEELSRGTTHVHIEPLSADRARQWVTERAGKLGLQPAPGAIDHLIAAVGMDLAHLAMELDKLFASHGNDHPVTPDDVARLVGVRSGETLSDWIQRVLQRDVGGAAQLLDGILSQPGLNGVRVVMSAGTALIGTRLARALLDGGASPRSVEEAVFRHIRERKPAGLGVWRMEARRWAQAAARWSTSELDRAIRALYEADRALKTSGVSDESAVLRGVLLQMNPSRAAA